MAASFEHGYALLVAVDANAVAKWALPDVIKDVGAIAGVLTDPERCGYQPSNVKVISGLGATRQGILEGLEWLQQHIEADQSGNATAFLYYSGHGWRDEKANPPDHYPIPYDVREQNLRLTSLPARDFAAAVAGLRPKRLFVALDCCHAAGIDAKEIAPGQPLTSAAISADILMAGAASVGPSDGGKGLEALTVGAGRAVLSSSQGTQQSYIRKDRQMSVFTYHLVEALTGHAGAPEGASEILVSDVMSHVWRRVPETVAREVGKRQDPDYQASGNFPVALLLGGKGLPKGAPPPEPIEDLRARTSTAGDRSIAAQGAVVGDHATLGDNAFMGRDRGDVITVGDISGQGIAVGRNSQVVLNALPAGELDRIFAPLIAAIQSVPADRRDQALEVAGQLKQEAAGGDKADDRKVARLIDRLASLAPGAVSALTGLFASPALSGLAGSATEFVLEKLKRD